MKRSAIQRKTPMERGAAPMKRSPMTTRSRKPARTKALKEHMGLVAGMYCIVCRNLRLGESAAELHHPRFLAGGGQKSADTDVIPLCPNHHRLGGWGVAFHAGPEEFQRRYGTEQELLEQTRRETAALKERK